MSLDVDASVVLAPYLEPLVRGRRIAILGDSTGGLALGLIERGARLIHVYDPDPTRAAQAAAQRQDLRGLSIAPLPTGEMLVRDGAFDTVIVPDLSLFSKNEEVIGRARKLTSINGAAVVASLNPERKGFTFAEGRRVLNYYELYDAVSLQFPEVRMLGQAPFRGYVVADFAPDEEPDVTVDTSLLINGAEEPRWFIALGSRAPVHLDPYVIVQVPMAFELEEPTTQRLAPKTSSLAELEDARGRVKALEGELEAARETIRKAEVYRAAALRTETVEAQLQAREQQLAQSESRSGDAHVRSGQLEGKVRDLDEELRRQRDRAFRLSKELEDERKNRTKVEVELGMMRRASELPAKFDKIQNDENAAKIASLEAELKNAKAALASVQSEIATKKSSFDTEMASTRAQLSAHFSADNELSSYRDRVQKLEGLLSAQSSSTDNELSSYRDRVQKLEGLLSTQSSTDNELSSYRDRVQKLEGRLSATDKELSVYRERVEKLEGQLAEARSKLTALELSASQAEIECSRLAAKNVEAAHRLSGLENELAERNDRIASLDAALVAQAEAADDRVNRLLAERDAERSNQLTAVSIVAPEELIKEHEHEVDRYERLLMDRAHELGVLRAEVSHREQLVRELLIVLEESSGTKTDSSVSLGDTLQALHAQLDQLAALAARREADLQAANWKIQQLEHGQSVTVELGDSEIEAALVASRGELDALRQALAQERDARIAGEQGVGLQAMWDQVKGNP